MNKRPALSVATDVMCKAPFSPVSVCRRVAFLTALWVALGGVTAAAAAPPKHGKLVRIQNKKRPRGTLFFGELAMGAAFGNGFAEGGTGIGTRVSLGVGGGFKGILPRFYFVATGRYTRLTATVARGTQLSDMERVLFDLSAGLRVLIPTPGHRRLRFFGEVQLGRSVLQSTAVLNDRERYITDDSRFAVYVTGGAQYRLHRNLSVGLSAEWALPTTRDSVDFVADVSRLQDPGDMQGWLNVSATFMAHF